MWHVMLTIHTSTSTLLTRFIFNHCAALYYYIIIEYNILFYSVFKSLTFHNLLFKSKHIANLSSDCFSSMEVKACFFYDASPASYSPSMSKLSNIYSSIFSIFTFLKQTFVWNIVAFLFFTNSQNQKPTIASNFWYSSHTALSYAASLCLFYLAVKYSLEADADYRKIGLVPRATFTDPSSSDQYKSSGTINMSVKGRKDCVTRTLSIQVFMFSALLWY